MANQVVIYCANPAPQTIAYSFSATAAGANWDTTKFYAVTVTASYDPDDENIWLTGYLNDGFAYNLATLAPMESPQAGVSPANADDVLVVTWTAPPGPAPHHYNVFIQGPNASATTYVATVYGKPMSDWDGSSEVTNDTLTFTITDPTDEKGTNVDAVMLTVDAGNKIVEIAGNHIMQLAGGVAAIGDYGGAGTSLTVASSQLIYDVRGTLTEITFNEALTGMVAGELLRYNDMRHTFIQTVTNHWSYRGSLDGALAVALNPVQQLRPSMRKRMIRNFQGYLVKRATVLDSPVQFLDVTVVGLSCGYDEWRLLMEYLKAGSRLWLIDVNESYTGGDHYPFPQYLCRLVDTDYVGSIGKNARNSYRLRFEVEEQKAQIGVS